MKHIESPSEKSFGYTISLLLAVIVLYRFHSINSYSIPLLILIALLLVTTLLKPSLLKKFNYAWTLLGQSLGKVTNPIILTLVYFTLITPINLLLKLLKKDILNLNFDFKSDSYWIAKQRKSDDTMKVQF